MIYSVKLKMDTSTPHHKTPTILSTDLEKAVEFLRNGKVIGIPTDTTYGLAADVTNIQAIDRVFSIKGRKGSEALPIFISEVGEIDQYATGISEMVYKLSDAFWPGPLTMVLNSTDFVPKIVRGGMSTVAIRIPDHWVPREIIRLLGRPITGTSANISGNPSLTHVNQVQKQLGNNLELLIDGGQLRGMESTIIDLTVEPPIILRKGAVKISEIENVLKLQLS